MVGLGLVSVSKLNVLGFMWKEFEALANPKQILNKLQWEYIIFFVVYNFIIQILRKVVTITVPTCEFWVKTSVYFCCKKLCMTSL